MVETLIQEQTLCVFGIPGVQENELWDTMKSKGLPYLLVTHEMAAAYAADGYARATGRPGVICVVPGPGLTNSLSGIGEALLDSIPMVCIVGDVCPAAISAVPGPRIAERRPPSARDQARLCRGQGRGDSDAVRQAFLLAMSGEPGPVGVVIPYNLLIEKCQVRSSPLGHPPLIFDENAFQAALALLSNCKLKWGIYAGLGCMDYTDALVQVAEILQAPVATSVSGKGTIPDCHPLAVGYGYAGQGTCTAEKVFKHLDGVLAIGVKYSEVSTAFYAIPHSAHLIHVDINPHNLGAAVKAEICVAADAGVFLHRLIENQAQIQRPPNPKLTHHIQAIARKRGEVQFLRELRQVRRRPRATGVRLAPSHGQGLAIVRGRHHVGALVRGDVPGLLPAHLFQSDRQSVDGLVDPGGDRSAAGDAVRQVVTVTGDGCFLMTAIEMCTAAREGLPVKFFILDDQAYHYMQVLQKAAYLRTTATVLAHFDYAAFAHAVGVGYQEIDVNCEVGAGVRAALATPGPVLVCVRTDYGKRPCRWIETAKARYTKELTTQQKIRFAARAGHRAIEHKKLND